MYGRIDKMDQKTILLITYGEAFVQLLVVELLPVNIDLEAGILHILLSQFASHPDQ